MADGRPGNDGAAGPARRLPRAGDRLDRGRSLLRPHAGRLRRRGDQDRAGRGRSRAHHGQVGRRPFALCRQHLPQQAAGLDRSAPRGRPRPDPRPRRAVRRDGRELQARHPGKMGPRLGGAVEDQPAPGDGAHLGLRPDWPLLPATGLRRGLRGRERPAPPHRRSRPRALARRRVDDRLHRRPPCRLRRGDGADGAREDRTRPGDRRGAVRERLQLHGSLDRCLPEDRLRARAHRLAPDRQHAQQPLSDGRRQLHPHHRDGREPVPPPLRGDGPARARRRSALRPPQRAQREPRRSRRDHRQLDGAAHFGRPRGRPAQGLGAGHPHLHRGRHLQRPALPRPPLHRERARPAYGQRRHGRRRAAPLGDARRRAPCRPRRRPGFARRAARGAGPGRRAHRCAGQEQRHRNAA